MDDARHIPIRISLREPQAFAKGGLVKAAKKVAQAGRHGDDLIVHVNRAEFDTLRREWGEPTINPDTGLPEFFLGGLQKWFSKNPWAGVALPVVTSALGLGNTLGGGVNSLLGGALSPAIQNAVGSALLGGGLGALTGGGQGALTGALAGGVTPLAMDFLTGGSSSSSGGLLSGLFGGGTGASTGFNGSASDRTRGLADMAAGDRGGAPTGGGLLSGLTGGSGALGGVTNLLTSKNAIPLAIGALALGSAFASKKPSAAQRAAAANDAMANARFNRPLASAVPFNRQQTQMSAQDYYDYGLKGGRNQFAGNQLPGYAAGGLAQAAAPQVAGMSTGPSGYVRGPGGAREDKIPALLSDNEYVIDAETLALLGDGSPEHGAKKLDELRANIRRHKGGALSRGQISPDAKPAESYMRGRR